MNGDLVDALTMVPGILMVHWFAWWSDDFMFKTSALAWVWVCVCSMNYHLHGCDKKMLRSDLRAQWVAQAVMSLCSPQSTWPIVLGGLAPVGKWGRIALNGLGAYHFLWHTKWGGFWLALGYVFYLAQYLIKKPWMHSIFHMCLHCAGACGILDHVVKYPLPIPGVLAYAVEILGILFLLPTEVVVKAIRSLARLLGPPQSGKTRALSDSKKRDGTAGPAPTPTTTAPEATSNVATSA